MPKRLIPDTKRILNCLPSQKPEQDWKFEAAAGANLLAADAAIPAQVDLRAAWWEVGDQGYTGSCVGWAAADSVIRWHMVRCNLIQPADHLAVRYLWMAAKETDEFTTRPTAFIELDGTSLKAALNIARKYGMVLDDLCPFKDGKLYQGETDVFYSIAAQRRVSAYYNLTRNQDNWRMWLAGRGPILSRLEVDKTWYDCTASHGNLDAYDAAHTYGGHAIAIVGYTPDRFIVRNSWGTSWGDGGFAYASPDYARAAFTEAYGVVV